MKTSIATVSVPGALREKLEAIARAGFDGVEIFEQDFIADEGSPASVGEMRSGGQCGAGRLPRADRADG